MAQPLISTDVGAAKTAHFTAALTATEVEVKQARGRLYGWHVYNPNSTDAYVQFFDADADSVTVGTTNPVFVLWVPALGAVDEDGDALGVRFETGITIAATTTATGSTGPTTGLHTTLFYA